MVKSFKTTTKESTCQKRITVCEIYDKENNLLARESNRCSPDGGTCHRIGIVQNKDNYDKDSSCNWVHAEINTIAALPENSQPFKAIIYGHSFFCDSCEQALKAVGVKAFQQS